MKTNFSSGVLLFSLMAMLNPEAESDPITWGCWEHRIKYKVCLAHEARSRGCRNSLESWTWQAAVNIDSVCFLKPGWLIFHRFLDEVQSYSDVNKMSVQNLGTVFGPNILRPKVEDPVTIMEGNFKTCFLLWLNVCVWCVQACPYSSSLSGFQMWPYSYPSRPIALGLLLVLDRQIWENELEGLLYLNRCFLRVNSHSLLTLTGQTRSPTFSKEGVSDPHWTHVSDLMQFRNTANSSQHPW